MLRKEITIKELEDLKGLTVNFDIESKYWIEDLSEKKIRFIQFGTTDETQKYRIDTETIDPIVFTKLLEIYQSWKLIGSNLQFDIALMKFEYDVVPVCIEQDTYIMARMLQEPDQGLKKLAKKYLNIDPPDFEFSHDPDTKLINYTNSELIDSYCEYDITVPSKVAELMNKNPIITQSEFIYRLEKKMALIAAKSEARGMSLDLSNYSNIQQQLAEEIAGKQQKLNELAGYDINPGSTKQVGKLLFEDMNLECRSITKKGTKSVSEDALFHLKGNQVVDLITELKSLKSIQSTLANLPKYKSSQDVVHVNMKLIGYDATSRIYNAPSITSLPKVARSMFVARPGHRLVYLDLKAAELFLAMADAEQLDFIEQYNAGKDLHIFTASKVFNKPEESIAKDSYERAAAKVVNFATMYGGTGFTIAKDLNISESEGEAIHASWFNSFPKITEQFGKVKRFSSHKCMTKTPFGRIRQLANRSGYVSAEQLRQSINTRYQSGVADCLKVAMTFLDRDGYSILTSVFDSILLEVPDDIPFEKVNQDIEKALDFTWVVPNLKFKYDIAEGRTWLEAYEKC